MLLKRDKLQVLVASAGAFAKAGATRLRVTYILFMKSGPDLIFLASLSNRARELGERAQMREETLYRNLCMVPLGGIRARQAIRLQGILDLGCWFRSNSRFRLHRFSRNRHINKGQNFGPGFPTISATSS